ncbi:MAG: 50S ribosomal protein L19e [Candidatus Woesearchaeota archaeon]
MKLTVQRRLAATLLGVSEKRVRFDQSRLNDVKEAITKTDLRGLIGEKAVTALPVKGVSRSRARKTKRQKAKGLQKSRGSRKGTDNARTNRKDTWINRLRLQRAFIRALRDNGHVSRQNARLLLNRAKGGFFRSRRHLKLYVEENNILIKQGVSKSPVAKKTQAVPVKKKTSKFKEEVKKDG